MKDFFIPLFGRNRYFITISNHLYSDKDISLICNISFEEFQNILRNFGASNNLGDCYFNNEKDCKKCCKHLNEKYGVIMKLIGD